VEFHVFLFCDYAVISRALVQRQEGRVFLIAAQDFYLRSAGKESRFGHRLFLLSFFMLLVRPFEQIPRQYLD
jgi:hypothetical protein